MSHKPKIAAIVQARLSSSRLPRKIMHKIGGRRVLEHCIERLHTVCAVDCIVIATTDKDSDTLVAEVAIAAGAEVFRGDETDVLGRYLGAARAVDADIIMRVTSDCPLLDPDVCTAVLKLRDKTKADYAANNMPRLFPHGLDCEVFTRQALERAALESTAPYDREHVTPWLRREPSIRRANLIGPGWPANQQRWTLDFPEDLDFLTALFTELPQNRIPSWQEVLSFIGQRPGLARINAHRRVKSFTTGDSSAPCAVFYFEASAKIGLGHAMRCNTLQSRLEALGWRCRWAVGQTSAAFLDTTIPLDTLILLPATGVEEQVDAIATAVGRCDVLIVDHYDVEVGFSHAMRQYADRIVYFDDLANRTLDADLIINPTPGFSPMQYSPLNTSVARYLLGPTVALLRQQFSAQRPQRLQALKDPSASSAGIRHVLVAFGGSDPLNGTGLALDVLASRPHLRADIVLGGSAPHLAAVEQQIAKSSDRFKLWTDVADMAGRMVAADLAIGAPGTSAWERGCLGLPSLLVGIAENQRANADFLAQSGASLVAGFLTDEPRSQVTATLGLELDRLSGDPGRHLELALAAAELYDGRGAQRVATALLPDYPVKSGQRLQFRLAEATDEALLLSWQMAPETSRFALNPRIPSSSEHHAWLLAKLASDLDWLILGEIDGTPAGFVRLDGMGEDNGRPQFLISIATAPGRYRQGIGSALLAGARHLAPAAHFYAKILKDNFASMALFDQAGYSLASDGYLHSYSAPAKAR